ncbi:hypothetical protein HDV06_003091 [Boothiomyces sp. JEL0866]|nr:hypothetical protein HDV06_003091 [Boothiomyces sp. JEL0866]
MLGYYLQKNLPDFKVTVMFKNDSNWKEFVNGQFKSHGWEIRVARDRTIKNPEGLDQLVWYDSGQLIGNARDFSAYAKSAYNQDNLDMDDQLLKDIAAENSILA